MRIWETRFQVYDPIPEFPIPNVVVEEIQESPDYGHYGKNRKGDKGSQLVYTLSGEGRFSVNEKEYVLRPGVAFLAQHCDERTGYYFPKNAKEPWIFLWISFFGGFSADCVNSLVRHYGYIYELPRETGVIAEIEAFKGLKGSIVRLSPLAGAKLFMDVICGLDSSINRQRNDSSISSIHRAQMLLMKKISEGVNVQDIADELSISREHFSRVFKKHTGISPNYYIRREKLKYSCELLKETELSVKEISQRVGYGSVASFCRIFKSFLKMTPEQFRKIGHYPGWL